MRLLQLNENLKAVEAVLFAMGDPVDEFRLSEAIGAVSYTHLRAHET